ncbi:MAG: hypothetical protein CMQ20_18090 [Gammaproteobacteria bacterium]|nr:hypothetical protein [Gammaproteobacteria bacterium]
MKFEPAIREIGDRSPYIWGPTPFKDYLAETGQDTSRKTPEFISVDHLEKLNSSLKNKDIMVLRMGQSEGTGTQFVLIRIENQINDLFFLDDEIFGLDEPSPFIPNKKISELFPFYLFEKLSETNLVNFAFASGLLSRALSLDNVDQSPIPATGSINPTFEFCPHSKIQNVLKHKRGQVQVDGVFLAERNGSQALFVLEAKVGSSSKTLAKHKLLYSVLALSDSVPPGIPICPVYLRVNKASDGLIFRFAEIDIADPREETISLDAIKPISTQSHKLPNRLSLF